MNIIDHLPLFIFLALLAEILGTVGGFGSSLLFVPIASYFLDFHSVLGITAIFHVSSNITKIAFFRKGFDRKVILTLGIPAVLFVISGAFISKYIPTESLEITLAAFLIITSLIFLVFKKLEVKPTVANSVGGGVLSGLIAGVLGTGGAIRGIVLTAFNMKTEVFIATSAIIDLGIDASRSVVYTLNGFVHTHDLYLIPILLVVSVLGTWIGKKILEHVSQDQFRTTVLVLILITGLITLGKVLLPKEAENGFVPGRSFLTVPFDTTEVIASLSIIESEDSMELANEVNPDLESEVDTLTLFYAAFACDCPDWIDYSACNEIDSLDNWHRDHSYYLEPADQRLALAWQSHVAGNQVRFIGRKYREMGYPENPEFMDPNPPIGLVFRYYSYELIRPFRVWGPKYFLEIDEETGDSIMLTTQLKIKP